ncbi:MAG: hypothetical protein FIB01_10690 [Gemmatimonadetes bacterium]|nr:hypothetical protein [Gemmatimonadota bacterium]
MTAPPVPPAPEAGPQAGAAPDQQQLGSPGGDPAVLSLLDDAWSGPTELRWLMPLVRQLPTRAPWLLQGVGPSRGAIDLGSGLALVFGIVAPRELAAESDRALTPDLGLGAGVRPLALLSAIPAASPPAGGPRSRAALEPVPADAAQLGIPSLTVELPSAAASRTDSLLGVLAIGLAGRDALSQRPAPAGPIAANPGGAPMPETHERAEVRQLRSWRPEHADHSRAAADPAGTLLRLLAARSGAGDRANRPERRPAAAASVTTAARTVVLPLPGSVHAVGAAIRGNGRYSYLSPRRGAQIAVAEAARDLACTGVRPRAVACSLCHDTPGEPGASYRLREALLGLGEACAAFSTPLATGNVALRLPVAGDPGCPAPLVGMVGVLEAVSRQVPTAFQEAGDSVILLGDNSGELGGSEYLRVALGMVAGSPPAVDLRGEKALQETLLELAAGQLAHSARGCSQGGLAVCLADCTSGPPAEIGVRVAVADQLLAAAVWFGAAQGRAVKSCADGAAPGVLAVAERHGVPARIIGVTGGRRLVLDGGGVRIDVPVALLAPDAREGMVERQERHGLA